MRNRRNVILGGILASWVAIACSSGTGTVGAVGSGYEHPSDLRETPPQSRDTPPLSRDTPPHSDENPGSQGGGPGGGGGGENCPTCDGKYACLSNGKKQSLNLKPQDDGTCSAGEGIVFDCTGKVTQAGTPIGTWSGAGGNYTVNVMVNGQSTTLTCAKSSGTTTTDAGTVTPTPTPTPTDAGAGTHTCTDLQACCAKITDAATKTSCTNAYNAVKTNESSCNTVYASFAGKCP